MESVLIVGLGNPGKSYEGTRHNIGFAVLDLFAKKHALTFRDVSKYQGLLAKGEIHQTATWLLKPTTFMNLSGVSVAAAIQNLPIVPSQVLVVVDDVDLPFGEIRLKINSGPGTHNGLKSIAQSLQSDRYARLRIGIGKDEGDLADFVLSRFSQEEQKVLPEIFEKVIHTLEIWLDRGITRAMDFANRKSPSNPSNGEP